MSEDETMNDTEGTAQTPEEVLSYVARHGATGTRQAWVIANAALLIREGLDNLAKAEKRAGKRKLTLPPSDD